MFNIFRKQKGFTIIELVIAIFLLAFAVVGVYNAFSTIVILTNGASSRFTASYLAQEGIEIVRNIRDNNWLWLDQTQWKEGLDNCETGCEGDYKTATSNGWSELRAFGDNYLNIGENGLYSYTACDPNSSDCEITNFKRKITITQDAINTDILKVSVLVTWEVKDETFSITADEELYNWY